MQMTSQNRRRRKQWRSAALYPSRIRLSIASDVSVQDESIMNGGGGGVGENWERVVRAIYFPCTCIASSLCCLVERQYELALLQYPFPWMLNWTA
jgi:hypothetical protein